jgi:hypothetical protein
MHIFRSTICFCFSYHTMSYILKICCIILTRCTYVFNRSFFRTGLLLRITLSDLDSRIVHRSPFRSQRTTHEPCTHILLLCVFVQVIQKAWLKKYVSTQTRPTSYHPSVYETVAIWYCLKLFKHVTIIIVQFFSTFRMCYSVQRWETRWEPTRVDSSVGLLNDLVIAMSRRASVVSGHYYLACLWLLTSIESI